jgi:hypothetical protein
LVEKLVSPDPQGIGGTLSFPMTVTCTNMPNPMIILSLSVQGNSSIKENNLPVGSKCTIAETLPLPSLPAGCSWLRPQYSPQSVTIPAGIKGRSATIVETITNGYTCTGSLTVIKEIGDPFPPL